MATTKIKNTTRSQVSSDVKLETVVHDSVFHSNTILDSSAHSDEDHSKVACAQHPLAALLGTFTGATWDEIRQEIAQDHQKEDADALKG